MPEMNIVHLDNVLQTFPMPMPMIDRIDSSKPYQKDNIEVVSTRWNLLKSDSTVEERFAMGKEAALKIGYKWPPEPAEL